MNDLIANQFEFWGAASIVNFSDDMYNNQFYSPIFIWMLITVVVVALVYYFFLDSAKINKWWGWLIFGLILSIVNFGIAWNVADAELYSHYAGDSQYTFTELLPFSVIVALWAFIYYLVFSFIFKRFSTNSRHTPWKSIWPKR